MSEEIEILVKIGNRSYEGKLHPQHLGQRALASETCRQPVFSEPYAEMVTITDQGNCWEIKPKHFLRTEDFREIVRIVRQYGGHYVSAGNASHFRGPKARTV